MPNDKNLIASGQSLYEKLFFEYGKFYEEILKLSPEEIIKRSYEKVFKEDIVACFEGNWVIEDFELEDVEYLLAQTNTLNSLYEAWMRVDESYMDRLRDAISDFVSKK